MKRLTLLLSLGLLVLLLAMTLVSLAQPTAYSVRSDVIASGGSALEGGNYAIKGTLGQANVDVLDGGSYRLTSGFYRPGAGGEAVYLPLIRN